MAGDIEENAYGETVSVTSDNKCMRNLDVFSSALPSILSPNLKLKNFLLTIAKDLSYTIQSFNRSFVLVVSILPLVLVPPLVTICDRQ